MAGNNISSHYVPNLGQSVFDYIEKHNARTSIFYNFMFMPNVEQPVQYIWLSFLYQKHFIIVIIILKFFCLGVKTTVIIAKFKCMAVLFK